MNILSLRAPFALGDVYLYGLLGIVGVVVCSVFWRYILNDSPTWTEQVALLAINVAMSAARQPSGIPGILD